MEIQSNRSYAAFTPVSSSPQQRQTSAAFADSLADKVAISQAASVRTAEEAKGGGTYDFTNMTPNQMGQLRSDGKITGGFWTLTEAQFQAGMQANLKGLTGAALQDAMNVANNTPANYIQLYTKGIKDSKLAGIDTTGLESILHQMEAFQGKSKQTKSLDEVA